MKVFSIEEFAARRRRRQEEVEAILVGVVAEALHDWPGENWYEPILEDLDDAYAVLFVEVGGEGEPTRWNDFRDQIETSLRKTTEPDEDSAERIATWLATAVLNASSLDAAATDPEPLVMEWVTMEDESVRATHRDAEGQQRPVGEMFLVGGEEMPYPGYPGVAPSLWMNCRCALAPVPMAAAARADEFANHDLIWVENRRTPKVVPQGEKYEPSEAEGKITRRRKATDEEEKTIARGDWVRVNEKDEKPSDPDYKRKKSKVRPQNNSLAAAVDTANLSVLVALPAADQEFVGEEQKHVTLAFLGEFDGDVEAVKAAAAGVAGSMEPFTAMVSGRAHLGPDEAKVVLIESDKFAMARDRLLDNDTVVAAVSAADTHPHFVPHMTITYEAQFPDGTPDFGTEVIFDRLALWHGEEQDEFTLGASDMPDEDEVNEPTEVEEPTEDEEVRDAVPWFGVLAPEGVRSGDGRKFSEGSLTHRELPLPLTWQKASSDGHSGSVTVAKIEKIVRHEGQMWASGHFLDTPEADEVIGLIGEFGKFGVSIDADDAQMEMDEENEEVVFTSARIASASIVSIPAFAEAFVQIGTWEELEALMEADAVRASALVERFRRGPGWITHPVDTKRIYDYWTKPGQEGYAKVGWGTPGDFRRCRVLVGEKIAENSPEDLRFINHICAQWHHDVNGYWPGDKRNLSLGDELPEQEDVTMSESGLSLTAGATPAVPAEWFSDPGLDRPTALTVTDDGRVFGHLAAWGTCHIGLGGEVCVEPPNSPSNYAYFLTGEVITTGGRIPVGQITIGGGHAPARASATAAAAHYDSTSTVIADVTAGEDEHGIWVAGSIRGDADEDVVAALRAAALSGDWRRIGGSLELVAALAVNVPGFPIPRTQIAASAGVQTSLVASGVVADKPTPSQSVDMDALAEKVAYALDRLNNRRARAAALRARVNGTIEG